MIYSTQHRLQTVKTLVERETDNGIKKPHFSERVFRSIMNGSAVFIVECLNSMIQGE